MDNIKGKSIRAAQTPSAFATHAAEFVDTFASHRAAVESQIRAGDLGLRQAREHLAKLAAQATADLAERAGRFTVVPPHLRQLIDRAEATQRTARESKGTDALLRDLIALHRETIRESQLATRAQTFQARRDAIESAIDLNHKRGQPGTLAGLRAYHDEAVASGDDAATEWARRELRAMRPTVGPDDQRTIDHVTRRPDVVTPSLVSEHLADLQRMDDTGRAAFAAKVAAEPDASAAVALWSFAAAFEGKAGDWRNKALASIDTLPEAAVADLSRWESTHRQADADAARVHADLAADRIRQLASLEGVEPPSAQDLALQAVAARESARIAERSGSAALASLN